MKVYYCKKEFDNAVEYLASKHTVTKLTNKGHLEETLKGLLEKADRTNVCGTAGFVVTFDNIGEGEVWADISVTPYLSYQDEEDHTTYLEV